jgi:hypothetical protein
MCGRGTIAPHSAYGGQEVNLRNGSRLAQVNGGVSPEEERGSAWVSAIGLAIWLLAAAVIFLPFAYDTSPWDAVRLQVPGNQGNWWHFLAGAPCFLAFPMIWLRLRSLFSSRLSTAMGRRLLWCAAGLSIAGTFAVETPFLLHLAGTSDWQRFAVLSLGFGIAIASGAILYFRRRRIPPSQASLASLNTAYLANMALCLVVYSGVPGKMESRSGWFVSIVIFWPILFELVWIFIRSFRRQAPQFNPRGV